MNVTAIPTPTAVPADAKPDPKAAKAKKAPKTKGDGEEAPKKGKKKLLMILLALCLAGGGAWVALGPEKAPEAPKPGEVITLDPIQINLAGEHYLRIGIAMQMTDAAHEVDGSKALDATIAEFSGHEIGEVNQPKMRRELKEKLFKELEKRYHHEVLEVYFTEFVTQ